MHQPSAVGPPDSLEQPGRLHCYDCGTDYDHLGTGHHHGRCPACGSPGVSPAGELHVASDPEPVGPGASDSAYRVDAVDDTGRRVGYWLSPLEDDRAQLVFVDVGGVGLGPGDERWPEDLPHLVPEWFDGVLDVAGLTLVAPATVVGD